MGKYFYESYKELKIDAEFMIDVVYKKIKNKQIYIYIYLKKLKIS
jgi:hypothetical protein